ncbi:MULTISPECIES: isochorismatase family protein [Bradyrhizobium]|jgi:maleamate amidohydrolase|uniref:isochorismatase family protein n=1 Tax=Bradyrhizobium TaxID=374 RepID=UPI000483E29D|nr:MULTISPECIES: isochorismatase family protein [Bradyrhizobium]MCS3447246.1 nicotinamidase-related amidase [Bradyrhizobium elkanii]MCS3561617.1 nicotinamidase-related amidase [Bradyrhizobium elkanii]MCW2148542.1 nicotinamidase-related amidase [Bradyrhizobium elkanii]MCW2352371.1 nicotinamidase-related amidase [Bradyrhizobium elkanii]MCW2372270.1 nicotinamidase-related amidase [Bradyrhizobium elkanii]
MIGKEQPWDDVIPLEERETYAIAGLGGAAGFGKRPALLVIDVQYRSVGDRPMPIREAIKQYPTSCGEAGWQAITQISELMRLFRGRRWPVIFPHVACKVSHDQGAFAAKIPGIMQIPPEGYDFVREVAPEPGELLLPKTQASAFFGTPLTTYLVGAGIDSLVVTGCTTSGCVRASVVDACALNFKSIVPSDAVYDRSPTSHAVNLFDIASKYADVMPTRAAIERLRALADDRNRDRPT